MLKIFLGYGLIGKKRKGVVLVLVLGAVAILTIVAVELAHRSSLDISRQSRISKAVSTRIAFQSGIEVAKALIYEKRGNNGYNTLADEILRPMETTLDGSLIRVQLSDEAGKLNVSEMHLKTEQAIRARRSLERIFEWLCLNDSDRAESWKKVRETILVGLASAENNGALFTLDDLRSFGVEREYIFGDVEHPFAPALYQFLTVYSEKRINLNTAPKAVLYGLDSEFESALVNDIDQWRGSNVEGTGSIRPFKTTKDLEQVPGIVVRSQVSGELKVVKNLLSAIQDSVTVSGRYYSARIDVTVDGRQHLGFAIIDAGAITQTTVRIMAFEEIAP
jgi:type II secretory pathway component PulK